MLKGISYIKSLPHILFEKDNKKRKSQGSYFSGLNIYDKTKEAESLKGNDQEVGKGDDYIFSSLKSHMLSEK